MHYVLDPVLWPFLLAVVLMARAWFVGRSGLGEAALALSLVVVASPATGNLWLVTLERQQPLRACHAASSNTVVVLGAGLDTRYPVDLPAEQLSHLSWRRAFAAVPLLREGATVVLAGGGRFRHSDRFTEAAAMAAFLQPHAARFDGVRLIEESSSRNTLENATFTAALLAQHETELDIVLVTSAAHMARARGTFEQAGFTVCAHAVAPEAQPAIPWGAWLPQISGLQKTAVAMREWAAVVLYRLQGWM
ncbi:MAG: YdcF family protein [Pseudomonadota bacterium]